MKTTTLLSVAALLGLSVSVPTGHGDAPGQKQRNVLFIVVDDLNPQLGCYGNPVVQTPQVDRLSARGVRFTRAYSQWTSCLPSRVSFLSGWYPTKTQVHDFSPAARDGVMKDVTYLGQHFKNNGYFTARLDKVFHIGHDDPLSWTVSEEPFPGSPAWTAIELKTLGLEGKILRQGRNERVKAESASFVVMDCADEELFDGRTAKRAVELLEDRAKDGQPFFLACGFRRPHLPWIAPKKYFDLYPSEKIQLPPKKPNGPGPVLTDAEHREAIAHYYACVTFMDTQVGKVLAALERTGLDKNTVVVFFGDQGYYLGERDQFFAKGKLWERSMLVPLIIAEPNMERAGVACVRPVGLVDLYPTLVELCGLPQPASGLQGASLVPLLANERGPWRDYALSFTEENPRGDLGRSIRTPRYRYTETSTGKPVELVDFEQDPNEWCNLVNDPASAAVLKKLQAQLRRELAAH